MKNKIGILLLIAILLGLFSSCRNESGNIWVKYSSEDFCATVRYELSDTEIYAKITVDRGATETIRAEFSSPDALRGAVAAFDGEKFSLTCENITIYGESAEKLMYFPFMLVRAEATSFEKLTEDSHRRLYVKTEDGEMIFDIDTGELISAELDGVRCDIIDFSWLEKST